MKTSCHQCKKMVKALFALTKYLSKTWFNHLRRGCVLTKLHEKSSDLHILLIRWNAGQPIILELTASAAFEKLTCSRLSVSENDRKSERATSGISGERDPGEKRRGPRPNSSPARFFNSPLTEDLEQAIEKQKSKQNIVLSNSTFYNLSTDI